MLSDRDQFPNFYRTVPSDSDFNPARLALLRHFNWTTVGIVFQHAKLGEARHGYVSVVPDMFASVASLSELWSIESKNIINVSVTVAVVAAIITSIAYVTV